MRIGLVTDSTAQLSPAEVSALTEATGGLFAVVPLTVLVDGESHVDGELTAADLCARMNDGARVSTSMATPHQFSQAFSGLVAAGAEAIVAVTMSAALSGTHDSAVSAAEYQKVFIDVVDSRTTSAGLAGALAVAAARISAGTEITDIGAELRAWCEESTTTFAPATLDHLRRGGRIGAASGLLGKALQIVPVLGLRAGVVAPVARVRTWSKAMARMVDLAATRAEALEERGASVEVEIQHADGVLDHPDVLDLEERFGERGLTTSFRTLSAIITAHVGPGAIGITVQSRP